MTVTEALELARSQGVEVTLDGDELVLKAEAAPPPGLLAILGRGNERHLDALRLGQFERFRDRHSRNLHVRRFSAARLGHGPLCERCHARQARWLKGR